MLNDFKIFAHRGVSSIYPENTMIAFKEAWNLNMDGIELDVQLSKDGEIVVIHDELIDRTSNSNGYVCNFSLQELKKLDFGSYKDKKFKNCKIPTLEEVLIFFENKKIYINIELKNSVFRYEGMEEKVIECIKKYQMEDYILVTSFNHQSIQKFQKLTKKIRSGILLYDIQFNIKKYIEENNIKYINPSIEYFNLEERSFLELKKSGKIITVYTLDDIREITRLKELNINVITNSPISRMTLFS